MSSENHFILPHCASFYDLVRAHGSIPCTPIRYYSRQPDEPITTNSCLRKYKSLPLHNDRQAPEYLCLIANQDAAAISRYLMPQLACNIINLDEVCHAQR
jgi:hypothetical protein